MNLFFFWLTISLVVSDTSDVDTLVVCPTEFREAIKPWENYRAKQGYKIEFMEPPVSSDELRTLIKNFAAKSNLENVVLVGDSADSNVPKSRLVPTASIEAKVNVKFGSDPTIPTDHLYADLDDDGNVDLNIGRLPVDTPEELTAYIQRVFKYEANTHVGPWQQRVNFVAGVGGFGQLADKLIEQSMKKIVTDLIPAEFRISVTHGSWRSPFCPDPRRFSSTAIGKFNEGCLFWIYVGHGHKKQLDRFYLPDRQYQILNNYSATEINAADVSPIAVFLACYTAATDDPQDGLAEVMLETTGWTNCDHQQYSGFDAVCDEYFFI